jgi:hypothetical protein
MRKRLEKTITGSIFFVDENKNGGKAFGVLSRQWFAPLQGRKILQYPRYCVG